MCEHVKLVSHVIGMLWNLTMAIKWEEMESYYKVNSFLYEESGKEGNNKMVCRFFILSIKPFFQFQVTSRFTLQLIHIHTFTVPPNAMQNAMFSVLS
jgi:hypothetical protein